MGHVTTAAYDQANLQNSKEPILVLKIEGLPFVFSSATVYTQIRYDDPGVNYDGTYVYDGLRPLSAATQKPLIDRQGSSSTISQKLEQWDGKASIETFNIKVIDKDGLVTQICTPGVYLADIMNAKVSLFYGFMDISYPEDYLLLFKGYVNQVDIAQGSVYFTFTDPSSKRKQVLFSATTSVLTTDILAADTTLTVSSTNNFYQSITNAKGIPDPGVTMGLVLNSSEIVTYTNADIIDETHINVVRGQFGTLAQDHSAQDTVDLFINLNDNPLSMALKIQLSGWNGPCFENIGVRSVINNDAGGLVPNSITLEQGVDAVRDYGLTVGDFAITSDSVIPGNNGIFTVADIVNSGRTIVFEESGILVQEDPGVGDLAMKLAIRSKYDVYPIDAGLGLTTDDVLTSTWERNRDTFVPFVFSIPIIGQETSGKTWIEVNCLKSIGAYSLTQGSRISMGITHPPLADDLSVFVDPTNVIQPSSIKVSRGLNTRFFYNEVLFHYKYDVISDTFFRDFRVIDADAQNRLNQVSVLELDMKGLDDSQNSIDIMSSRAQRILQRYKYSAETVELMTNFGTGHKVDAGDIVVLTDTTPPVLQIANTETGLRGVTNRIMEVQERSINISQGTTKMVLLSNNGFAFSDRYAVVSSASYLDPAYAHTTTQVRIMDSFSVKFPGAEYKKWQDYDGSKIRIHDKLYAQDGETFFTLDTSDPYVMHLDPPLSFTPVSGMVIEFAKYDSSSAGINTLVKATFAHRDSSASIFSASSSTVFVLDSGFSVRYKAGMIVYVLKIDGSGISPDVKIVSVVGDVVTIGPIFPAGSNPDLGFTPSPGDIMELGGFLDGGNGYRLI